MVARITTGKSIRGILHYNEQKVQAGQAELLLAGYFPQAQEDLCFRDKLHRFERLLEKAPRVKTNAVHVSLNFHPKEQLSPGQLTKIAASYMEQIGFGRQPYLVYLHHDAGHPHLHIVSTNITKDGERISLHNIGRNKSEPARVAIEQAFGLLPAAKNAVRQDLPSLPEQLEKIRYGTGETRRAVAQVVTAISTQYNVTSLAELNAALRPFGVMADRGPEHSRMHQRKGLIYSIIDSNGQKKGVPLKASSLPGRPTLKNLEKLFARHARSRASCRLAVRQQVNLALQQGTTHGWQGFLQQLNRSGIHVLFRQGKSGAVYGVTFLDHRNRAVINGRELGKGYGAKQLIARMTAAPRDTGRMEILPGRFLPPPPQARSPEKTRQVQPTGYLPADFLRQLLEADQQVAYLPPGLKPNKRKRKKRHHHL